MDHKKLLSRIGTGSILIAAAVIFLLFIPELKTLLPLKAEESNFHTIIGGYLAVVILYLIPLIIFGFGLSVFFGLKKK